MTRASQTDDVDSLTSVFVLLICLLLDLQLICITEMCWDFLLYESNEYLSSSLVL